MVEHAFEVDDHVWAKLKGYPWWPSQVVAEDSISPEVLSQKRGNQIPVYFFGSHDYGWFSPSDLRPFHQFKEELTKKKSSHKKLLELALKEECDPNCKPPKYDPNERRDMTDEENEEEDDEQESEEEEEEDDDDDDEETEEKIIGRRSKSSRRSTDNFLKRKRENDERRTSKRRRGEKEDEIEESHDKKSDVQRENTTEEEDKSQNFSRPSSAKSADDQYNGSTYRKSLSHFSKDSQDPQERLLRLRLKLQKFMQGSNHGEKEFSRANHYLTEVENFDLNYNLLKETKIGKVIKRISVMKFEEDVFNIVGRSVELLNHWKSHFASKEEDSHTVTPTDGGKDLNGHSSVVENFKVKDQGKDQETSSKIDSNVS